MLHVALPNKGALSEEAVRLVAEAGYSCRRYGRELFVSDRDNGVEFAFLRPRDIAVYVSRGVLELGITGRDLTTEAGVTLSEFLPLGFGASRFCYAVPVGSGLTPERFGGLRIATSFPELVRGDLRQRGIEAEIVTLDGAVEISVALGVADVIADVVESGRTLVEAGLETVGDPVLRSEALLVARDASLAQRDDVKTFIERLRGIVVARDFVMVEYDAPRAVLEQACAITPGIESPTIAPLSKEGWVAVKAMVRRKDVNAMMDELSRLGAKGIIVTDIRTCRL
jgi:ATP phosphoribosyltransferase